MAEPVTTPTLSLQNFFSSTLSSSIIAGDTVIPLNSVPTGTEGFLVIDQDNSSKEIIYYTSKGASSVTCPSAATGRGLGGTTAVSHSSGATVKMNVVSEYWTELQNGNAMGVNSIAAASLATSAITLGYTQITASVSGTPTTAAQVTGLTTTVTIPAGGRKIKITAFSYLLGNTTVNAATDFQIWDGTVGSGTQLSQVSVFTGAANTGAGGYAVAVVTPSAGSKTYNVGYHAAGGTSTVGAATSAPAFILVEAI